MRLLIFDTSVTGHHLEYIHHLYQYAVLQTTDEYFFVLPSSFQKEKGVYEWSESRNVHVLAIDDDWQEKIDKGRALKKAYYRSLLLKRYVNEIRPNHVFLIVLMAFLPFLPFLMPRGIKVSGVMYKIYLYRWGTSSILKRCFDVMNHILLVRSDIISCIFVLNDSSAASYLNRKYKTNKFVFLTDPFNEIGYSGKDIRNELNISDNDIVFLHYGGLSKRKGTLDILEAIKLLTDTQAKNKVFLFAGKLDKEIHTDFYKLTLDLKDIGRKIVIINRFCSNELLNDLCASSNFILCPYKDTDLSSGALSYASKYKLPVIGPKEGLIGKLIKRYNLGVMLDATTPEKLSKAISDSVLFQVKSGQARYFSQLTISSFCNIIFDNVKE